MSLGGSQADASTDGDMAALGSAMASVNLQPDAPPDAELGDLQSAMASTSLELVAEAESRGAAMRVPAHLLTLPLELRLRIYELLGMITPSVIDVDSSYTVHIAGSRTSVLSSSNAFRDCPDALNLIKASKQLCREVANSLYANTVFGMADLPTFATFLDDIGPTCEDRLTTIELKLCIPDDDDLDNIDPYGMLQTLTNLKTFTVAIDGHVLDVIAAQDEHFRSRFATQLSPPGAHWWSEESADLACQHMDILRQFVWGLLGQAKDEAEKREKFKILKTTKWMGPSARQRAAMLSDIDLCCKAMITMRLWLVSCLRSSWNLRRTGGLLDFDSGQFKDCYDS